MLGSLLCAGHAGPAGQRTVLDSGRMRPAPLLAVLLSALVADGADAQTGGLYMSHELGINLAPSLVLEADANDYGSICDEYINPFTDLMPAFCGDPGSPRTAWTNAFGGAGGILAGGAVGYGFGDTGRLRVELDYFFREAVHNEASAVQSRGGVTVAKLDGEVVSAEGRIGRVTAHSLFGNLQLDLARLGRATAYAGAGVGFAFTRVDHGLLWVRNSDPDLITSVVEHFPPDRLDDLRIVQRNLASTTSSNQTELTDRLFGYQVLFGLDYALTDSVSLGLKGRWATFGEFTDESPLDQLRSHPSNKRLDGGDPVTYQLVTGDASLFALSLNVKYRI